MMRARKFQLFPLCAAILLLGQTSLRAFDEPGKVLFLDSFDAVKMMNNVLTTQPVSAVSGGPITGVVTGKAKQGEGKKGQALEFTGDVRVAYDNFNAINFLGGEVSFWVKLNFDPNARNEKTRGNLRNQIFLSFVSSNGNRFLLYTCLKDICVGAQDAAGNFLLSRSVPVAWKEGEWRKITLTWGNTLDVSVDGEQKITAPWDGLFGSLPVEREKFRLYIGFPYAGNIESEYSMDELTVLGPQLGKLACRPRTAVPLLENAPVMDGKLDDAFWQRAGKVTGFVGLATRELDPVQPMFLLAYTNAGLYLGARIPLPNGQRPQAALTAHNSSVYVEDAFELFFQPDRSSSACYQLLANAIGTKAEYQHSDKKEPPKRYEPEWQVATSSKEGEWTAEMFVPYKALGLSAAPKTGEVWGANLIVDSAAGISSARTWAFTDGNFIQPVTFGELLFTGNARTVREERFADFSNGNPAVQFGVMGGLLPVVTIRTEFFDASGKSVRDTTSRLSDAPATTVGAQFLPAGIYTVRISAADESKNELFRQNVQFRAVNAFSLTVENYPYAGVAEALATVATLKDKLSKVSVQLLSPAGQTLATQAEERFDRGLAVVKLKTADLEPGDYLIQATALDAQGKSLDTAKQELKIFPKPKWWKNNLGLDHTVPPPWTPVKATDKGFGVWGRDYQVENGAFPRQIINQGKPMFKSAPRFILRAGGKEMDLAAAARQPAVDAFPDQVELKSAASIGGVSARAKGTLEFDGCYRFDLDLAPDGADKVESLTLELPLPREIGQFVLSSNGRSSSVAEIKEAYKAQFTPYFWLGNDDMGLAVFTESDQYWSSREAGAVEIIPAGDTTLMRLNIVRTPMALKGPISYSFGLMASPVRPIINGDPFVWFIYCGSDQVTFPENLTYPSKGLTDFAEGTLEFWARRNTAGEGTTEVFNILPADPKIGFIRCQASSSVYVDVNNQRLLTAKGGLSNTEFSHIALVWTPKTVALYVNGKCAATADSTDAFRNAMAGAGQVNGKLRFGDRHDVYSCPAVDVDDVRLSAKARYQGDAVAVPAGPMAKDAETRLLDPLDETFVPDGQDGLTVAGGCPSIGCRFIDGKFGKALRIEIGPARSAVELIKELNCGFGLAWSWHADPTGLGMNVEKSWPPTMFIGVDPGLKPRVDTFHRYGLPILPYVGYPAISGPSPLVAQWGSEWAIKPFSLDPYAPPEGHYMMNCNMSARGYADYLAAGTQWLMQEHGADGIYTDGSCNVAPSQNLYASSGYVDENGVPRPTTPIFGVREAMKRLYRVVKACKADGLVCNHISFNLLLPTLSFSDIYYTGEHEDYENMLSVRLRFSSKPWGLQESLLGPSDQQYSPWHTMVALALGTSILETGREACGDRERKWINLRKAYLAFDYKSAEWVPYFKNRDTYYTTADPKTMTSLYYHAGKNALLVVGNTDAKDRTIDLQLKLKAFGLEGAALRARNALTQVPLALTGDGKLAVPVRARSFVLVAVEPNR